MRRYRLAIAIVAAFLVVVIGLSAAIWTYRPTRVGLTTAFMLPDLFVNLPASPLKLVGATPIKEEVTFPAGSTQVTADLYRPDDNGRHGAILVVIGAAPRALKDPRVVRLATSAARAGLVVMIPELEHLLADEMVPDEIEEVVAAFQYLRDQPFVDLDKTGMVGFSVGAGIGLVAASDPRISDDVALFGSFGGYYDLYDVITDATTETIPNDGQRIPWSPDPKTLDVLRRSLIYYVDNPRDQDILTRIFLEGDESARQLGVLSPRSQAIFAVLDNHDPGRAAELFAALPADDQAILRRLSPSASLDGVHTELIIMHDRHDHYLPYVESRELAAAARQQQNEVHYAELDIFRHVNPRLPANPITFLANVIEFLFEVLRLMLRLT